VSTPLATLSLNYKAADPVIAAFHASKKKIRYLRGSRGSTKTTATIMELWHLACTIRPCLDGVRRSRMLIVRDTYPNLDRTTLKSVKMWVGQFGHGGNTLPPTMYFNLTLPDQTRVESEWRFIAISDEAQFDDFRSLELTGAWINEAVSLPPSIIGEIMGSLGRYPGKNMFDTKGLIDGNGNDIRPFEPRLIIDTNGAEEGSPWQDIEDNPPENMDVFIQVGAYLEVPLEQAQAKYTPESFVEKFGRAYVPNPKAVYARKIPGGFEYWADLIRTATRKSTIDTLVLNKWSSATSGSAVYASYKDEIHKAAHELDAVFTQPLHIGIDHSGLHPAASIGQVQNGQLVLLDEVVFDADGLTSFEEFVNDMLVPLLQAKYAGMEVDIILDPAIQRSQINKQTVYDVLRDHGLSARPAVLADTRTNDPKVRIEAVEHFLIKKRGFLASPNCTQSIGALRGGHKFLEIPGRPGMYSPKPAKGPFSHIGDAIGYLALGVRQNIRSMMGVTVRKSEPRPLLAR
jgi:hypothetical protein